jgi:hypothetical protein
MVNKVGVFDIVIFVRFVKRINMDTLTIGLRNPNAKKLLEDLADLQLISILDASSWTDRWRKLSATLPDVPEISEDDILSEIQAVRNSKIK